MHSSSVTDPMHRRGLLALVVTALLWSSGGLLIKSLPMMPLTIAGMRSAISAVVILLWLRRPRPTWSGAQWGSIISYAGTVVLFVVANKLTTAANAIFLQYTAPIWVAVFSWLIARERLTRIDVAAVIIVVIGMTLFFINRMSSGEMLGNLIAVASGISFAGVALFMRAQRGESMTESILFGNILAALLCVPFFAPFEITTSTVTSLVLLGVLQLGVSYILYSWAMKHVTAIEAILITTLEPLLNPVWVALFHGEIPSTMAIIGGAIVVTAVVARNFAHARHLRSLARH
jgi:drug/metabolite transporter (DMT)-like permease